MTVALIPVVVFAFIDTIYLAYEAAYRYPYGRIVEKIRNGKYALSEVFEADAWTGYLDFFSFVFRAFWSCAIWPVYLGLIAAYLAAWYYGALDALTKVAK